MEILTGIIGSLLGVLVTWLLGRRDVAKAQAAQEKAEAARQVAEAEMAAVRRRGEAPFFALSESRAAIIWSPADKTGAVQQYAWMTTKGLLATHRHEVAKDLAIGDPVILLVDNLGKETQWLKVKLDGQDVEIIMEPQFKDAHGLRFLRYPYNPAQHGTRQRLQIDFVTRDGVKDFHIYEIEHGRRYLHRIDPA